MFIRNESRAVVASTAASDFSVCSYGRSELISIAHRVTLSHHSGQARNESHGALPFSPPYRFRCSLQAVFLHHIHSFEHLKTVLGDIETLGDPALEPGGFAVGEGVYHERGVGEDVTGEREAESTRAALDDSDGHLRVRGGEGKRR